MDLRDGARRIRRFRFGRGSARREIDEEIAFHLEMVEAELRAAGMKPEAARREARRRFGSATRYRRECRDVAERRRRARKRQDAMTDLLLDLRFAVRGFRRSPGFLAVAILTLAIGIAANATIFGMVRGILLAPLPYGDPQDLVFVWVTRQGEHTGGSSIPDWSDYRARTRTLVDIAFHTGWKVSLTGEGEPRALASYRVTANLLDVLQVEPLYGRGFAAADAEPGAPPVTLLSWRLWNRLGADPGLVGGFLRLDDVRTRVIGVMPRGFEYPQFERAGDLWTPMQLEAGQLVEGRGHRWVTMVGRLADETTAADAQAELRQISAALAQEHPDTDTGYRARVVPLREQLAEPMRPALTVLLVTVGFVLLICCANVANLFLARTTARRSEVAVRTALGASRWRVVRQLLTESLLVALVAGVLGYAAARVAARLIRHSLPDLVRETMPSALEAHSDVGVLLATLVLASLAGLLFGIAPALRATRPALQETLRVGAAGVAGAPGKGRLRGLLVVGEVAVSVVLVAGAGMMIKGFLGLLSTNPGFEPRGALTLRITLPDARYADTAARRQFFDQVLDGVRALPGVERVGAASLLPLTFRDSASSFVIEGRPEPQPGAYPVASYRIVSPGYLDAMEATVVSGRGPQPSDRGETTLVAVVNQALVRRYFPGEDPLGRRLRLTGEDEWREIVGVIGDFRSESLVRPARPALFYPLAQSARTSDMYLVVRTGGDPERLAPAVREAVWSVDPRQPIDELSTLERIVSVSLLVVRLPTSLMSVFAVTALLLAVVGLYGVMSFLVVQRAREMGIRLALGASGGSIVRLVVQRALGLAGIGVLIGVPGAWLVGQALAALLQGVRGDELAIYAGVPLLLVALTLAASLGPVRRALRVDPAATLRAE